jgi:hypothetical protein
VYCYTWPNKLYCYTWPNMPPYVSCVESVNRAVLFAVCELIYESSFVKIKCTYVELELPIKKFSCLN